MVTVNVSLDQFISC